VIGCGVVLDLDALLTEIDSVRAAGVEIGENLLISERAAVILPYHRLLDAARESAAGDAKIGTTLRGIGPAYESIAARRAIRVAELYRPATLRSRWRRSRRRRRPPQGARRARRAVALRGAADARAAAERVRPHVADTGRWLRGRLASGAALLAEGAHGAMLDVCAGTYPFVTSSHCTSAAVASGLSISPKTLDASLLVLKAYSTRVGAGPFPTELHDATGEFLRKRGNEYGTSTGRPRRTGWFDAIVARTAVALSGAGRRRGDQARLPRRARGDSHLGRLPLGRPARLRAAGARRGRRAARAGVRAWPGWRSTTTGVTRFEELPPAAQRYVRALEDAVGAPAVLISTGPRREETIWRANMPLLASLPAPR
jgi:adenylosuccinate synthase